MTAMALLNVQHLWSSSDWAPVTSSFMSMELSAAHGTVGTETSSEIRNRLRTARLLHPIDNDTDFAWTDYDVTLTMTKAFSLTTSPSANIRLDMGGRLSRSKLKRPMDGEHRDFAGGTPVRSVGHAGLCYQMAFTGSVQSY